jgi:hypothetical protein
MKTKWVLFLLLFGAFLVSCRSTPIAKSIESEKTHSPSSTPTIQIPDTATPSPIPSFTPVQTQALPPGNYLIYWSYSDEALSLTSLDGSINYKFPLETNISSFDLAIDQQKFAYQDINGMIWVHLISSGENVPVPQPNILPGAFYETGPRWSADGNHLVYAVATIEIINDQPEVDENPSLWVSYINEDRVEKIIAWPSIESDPTWSPDGQWIVFISDHENIDTSNYIAGSSSDLYLIPTTCLEIPESCADLSNKITNADSSEWVGTPIWSPDSSQIAFICGSEDKNRIELCVYSMASGKISHLSSLTDRKARMDWSPNSDQIIYISDDDLYQIPSSGGNSKNLTNSPEWEEEGIVQWSPDGQYIAFSSSTPGEDNIGFSVINHDNMERVDYHDIIPGVEMFVSWLAILEPIEMVD